jgi:heme exporter protein B
VKTFWRVVGAVLRRDLRAELRRKEILITIGMFGLLTVVTFSFGFDTTENREDVLPGVMWTAFFFAGMLGLNRSAARDTIDGLLTGLRVSPADRGAVYVGKLLAHLVFMGLGELFVLVFLIGLFDLDQRHLQPQLFLLILVGTIGFLAVGTVFAVIGQKTRLREVMLPVLLLPILLPLVTSLVEGTALLLDPQAEGSLRDWLAIAVPFDVVFVAAGFLLYGYVLED